MNVPLLSLEPYFLMPGSTEKAAPLLSQLSSFLQVLQLKSWQHWCIWYHFDDSYLLARSTKRSLSAVSLDGIVDESNPRAKRVKVFSEQQREAIQSMQSASELPHEDRKRHYAALSRRLKQPGLPDGLIEKWKAAKSDRQKSFSQISLCVNFRDVYTGLYPYSKVFQHHFPHSSSHLPRFEFLKCFLLDESMQSMRIEAYYVEYCPWIALFELKLFWWWLSIKYA